MAPDSAPRASEIFSRAASTCGETSHGSVASMGSVSYSSVLRSALSSVI